MPGYLFKIPTENLFCPTFTLQVPASLQPCEAHPGHDVVHGAADHSKQSAIYHLEFTDDSAEEAFDRDVEKIDKMVEEVNE